MSRGKKNQAEAFRITDAAEPLSTDIDAREKRYLFAMSIRVICFIAAGIAAMSGILWLGMIFLSGALILPYVAVVMANAATPKGVEASPFGMPTTPNNHRELPRREDLS